MSFTVTARSQTYLALPCTNLSMQLGTTVAARKTTTCPQSSHVSEMRMNRLIMTRTYCRHVFPEYPCPCATSYIRRCAVTADMAFAE